MEASLRNYEEHHPELCGLLDDHAELYGWTRGLNRLAKYIQWVYVPAIKDPSAEQEEAGKTALGKLLARTVRTKVDFSEDIAAVKAEVVKKYTKMLDQRQDALDGLRMSLERRLQEYAGGQARLDLQWHYDDKQSIKISDPSAWAHIGDGLFIGQVGRSGHGLQRAFLVTLMHELAGNEAHGGPTLLLGFEEPELYQHPPQAKRLANVLEKLSSTGGNSQIVVTTHCPYFVSSKAFENVRMVRKDNVGSTRVTATTLVELEECLSSALCEKPKLPSSLMARLGQILEPSQNELFFTSAAVFVEGREDIAFISTQLGLSNQLGEFAELGCHFVAADGKGNMSRLVAIAWKLKIPFFVIFDAGGDGGGDGGRGTVPISIKGDSHVVTPFSVSFYRSAPALSWPSHSFRPHHICPAHIGPQRIRRSFVRGAPLGTIMADGCEAGKGKKTVVGSRFLSVLSGPPWLKEPGFPPSRE